MSTVKMGSWIEREGEKFSRQLELTSEITWALLTNVERMAIRELVRERMREEAFLDEEGILNLALHPKQISLDTLLF